LKETRRGDTQEEEAEGRENQEEVVGARREKERE